jgi:hypothetical protein
MNRRTLSSLGWDETLRTAYRRHDRADRHPARVSRVESGVCTLLTMDGASRASVGGGGLLAAAVHDAGRLPCPGDWVVVQTWPDARVTVDAVLPRRTVVGQSPGPPAASNVDIIVLADCDGGDAGLVKALRALAAPGRTVGVTGRNRAALVGALVGATVLSSVAGTLVPLAGGGAVIDTEVADLRRCPKGPAPLARSAEPG